MNRLILLSLLAANLYASSFVMPPGLLPGDHFRLAFLTKSTISGTSTNIADYDAFATSQANATGSLVEGSGVNWLVIGSTASESAATHLGGISVPIYRLDGKLIGNSSGDLWDGTIANPLNINQFGTVTGFVMTGTFINGTAVAGHELGTASIQTANPSSTLSSWITVGLTTGNQPIYAISATDFVVPTPAPEPATGVLLAGSIAALLWIKSRNV